MIFTQKKPITSQTIESIKYFYIVIQRLFFFLLVQTFHGDKACTKLLIFYLISNHIILYQDLKAVLIAGSKNLLREAK